MRSGDVPKPILLKEGQEFNFTIKRGVSTEDTVSVNYDDFINDVDSGDTLLVDGNWIYTNSFFLDKHYFFSWNIGIAQTMSLKDKSGTCFGMRGLKKRLWVECERHLSCLTVPVKFWNCIM